jgi:hypothetical protein
MLNTSQILKFFECSLRLCVCFQAWRNRGDNPRGTIAKPCIGIAKQQAKKALLRAEGRRGQKENPD